MTEAILPYMSGIHFVSIKGQNLALPPQSLEGCTSEQVTVSVL